MSAAVSSTAAAHDAGPHGDAGPRRGLTAAVVLGGVLNPLNTSSLAAALVPIGRDLHAGAAELALIVSVVYVVSAVGQPLMGSLAERLGPRRVFQAGLVLVALAGLVGGLATSPAGLIAARVLIGLGTSSAYPASMMLLQRAAERAPGGGPPTRQIGLLAATGNVMAAAGLPIGGLMVALFGWRSVFLVNVPLALLSLALAAAFVPRSLNGPTSSRPLDVTGVALFAVTVAALAQALTGAGPAALRAAALAVSLLAGAAWVLWERRAVRTGREPFIDVGLVRRSPALRDVYLRQFLLFGALYGMLYAGAQWLGDARALAASAVGLAMLPQSVVNAVSSAVVSRSARVRRMLLVAALGTALAGVLTLAASAASSVLLMSTAGALLGAAMGVGGVGNQAALVLAAPAERLGVASGLLRTSSYVGGFVMSGVMAGVYAGGVTDAGFAVFGALFLVCGTLLAVTSRRAPARAGG